MNCRATSSAAALYHLAQRRGFLSNLKAPSKDDDDAGKVESGINELSDLMAQAGSRTLGEYFASLDPEQFRIRQRWTARTMYIDELRDLDRSGRPSWPDGRRQATRL